MTIAQPDQLPTTSSAQSSAVLQPGEVFEHCERCKGAGCSHCAGVSRIVPTAEEAERREVQAYHAEYPPGDPRADDPDLAMTVAVMPRIEAPMIDACRNIVNRWSAAKVDGVLVDGFSASAVVTVYDALTDDNKAKFAALPIIKACKVAFKLLK